MSNILFERLLEERKRLGLTQDEMASIGGISKRSYCNYESGEREPTSGFLSSIAHLVDINYLLTGKRPDAPVNKDEQDVLNCYRLMAEETRATYKTIGTALTQPKDDKKVG